MKTFISTILIASIFSNVAMADCDFSKGITPLPNGTYAYSLDCHLEVGKLIQDNKTKTLQLADYQKAVELKNLAIVRSDQRAQLWFDTAEKSQDRLTSIAAEQKHNDFLYFGLGILATVATGFAVAKLTR